MNRAFFHLGLFSGLCLPALAGCGGGEPVPRRVATLEPEPDPAAAELGSPFDDLGDRLLKRERSAEQTTIDALANIGAPSVPALVTVLKDPDPLLRQNAARAFARMGPDAEAAVPELIAALADKDSGVRKYATRALGEIGPPAGKAVPALIQELRSTAKATEKAAKAQAANRPSEPGSAPPGSR